MLCLGPNNVVISTLYGQEGNAELARFLKKARLGKELLRQEGHPVDAHILLPYAKRGSFLASHPELTGKEVATLRDEKETQRVAAVKKVAAKVVPFKVGKTIPLTIGSDDEGPTNTEWSRRQHDRAITARRQQSERQGEAA